MPYTTQEQLDDVDAAISKILKSGIDNYTVDEMKVQNLKLNNLYEIKDKLELKLSRASKPGAARKRLNLSRGV